LFTFTLAAEHTLYVCGSISKGFVVGRRLEASGLYRRLPDGGGAGFEHLGFIHPYLMTIVPHPGDPATLFAAAGNGVVRMTAAGGDWKILTDWRHTEYQDIAAEPAEAAARGVAPRLYAAATDGIIASDDGGETWREASAGLRRRFIQTLAVDRGVSGTLLAGGEDGLYRSTDAAHTWQPVISDARRVTDLAQSPHDLRVWIAATQNHGIFLSRDSGISWARVAAIPVDGFTWNNVAFSPHTEGLLAASAFSQGVWVSEDLGTNWRDRSAGLPSRQVWRVRFDPDAAGRLYASVHEEAVFASDDAGRSGWKHVGLDGSLATDLVFVPAAPGGGR
jgi:photosystem II stability/assembly factor-like uncharacterized protein